MNDIFKGMKIFYSGSMQGAPEPQLDLGLKIVRFIQQNGGVVLSEHVPISNSEERNAIFFRNCGIDMSQPNVENAVHNQDLKWVDEATHMIVLANSIGSYGVGVEIEHAILKPYLGLKPTPILVLRQDVLIPALSWMLLGKQNAGCFVRGYNNEENALKLVSEFLLGN